MGRTNSAGCPQFIADYINTLCSRFAVRTVVLFGSRARGDHDEFSDWDLFVVASDLPEWKQRGVAVGKGKPPGVEVIAWTPKEVKRYIYRVLLLDVATDGIPLYGDMNWMKKLAQPHLAERKKLPLKLAVA